jgi:hypothetical protein
MIASLAALALRNAPLRLSASRTASTLSIPTSALTAVLAQILALLRLPRLSNSVTHIKSGVHAPLFLTLRNNKLWKI